VRSPPPPLVSANGAANSSPAPCSRGRANPITLDLTPNCVLAETLQVDHAKYAFDQFYQAKQVHPSL
jgi:hypothetical protein